MPYTLKILLASILSVFVNIHWAQVNGNYLFERIDSILVSKSGNNYDFAWAGGLNSIQVSKIDLNDDAFEDLFIFDRTGNTILTFTWDNTNSKWVFAPEYAAKFPKLEFWTLLRDFNCDGKKDIFSYVSGGIGIWKNTSTPGNISFQLITSPFVQSTYLGGSVANLYVSKVDIPDINDVDGDGDLDVLTFGIIGERVEYHQNRSVELGLGCDSIKYVVANTCWGHFRETGFGTNKCLLKDTCSQNVASPKAAKHSGSTVLSLDLNNDGVRDLLLGDVSFKNIVALYNDNKGVNMNTSMMSQDTAFPNGTMAVNLQLFPGSFNEDIDGDGIKDLIFSPNTDNETENHQSAWYYKNFGTNTSPVFAHIKNDWFQEEMLEFGTNAYPTLFDYNNDGLLDLFVGNFGYFDLNTPDHYKSQIALFQNVGTANKPIFEWVTSDFASASTLGLGKGLFPTFGDLDNDGDIDMLLGNHDGFLHYFTNSSGSMSVMTMTLATPQIKDDNNTTIDVGYAAKPRLFDIDGDNDLDLIIGEENANLNYYENTGGTGNYSFRLQSATFGNVDVSEWWTTVGNSSPCLFRNQQNQVQLFVGSERGQVFHFNNVEGNFNGTFSQQDSMVSRINFGNNVAPTVGFLNNDTIPDLIVGNKRGGLSLYMGTGDISLGTAEIQIKSPLSIYPNPNNGIINVVSEENYSLYEIFDQSGRLILSGKFSAQIDVQFLSRGIYILKLSHDSNSEFKQFIKE